MTDPVEEVPAQPMPESDNSDPRDWIEPLSTKEEREALEDVRQNRETREDEKKRNSG